MARIKLRCLMGGCGRGKVPNVKLARVERPGMAWRTEPAARLVSWALAEVATSALSEAGSLTAISRSHKAAKEACSQGENRNQMKPGDDLA